MKMPHRSLINIWNFCFCVVFIVLSGSKQNTMAVHTWFMVRFMEGFETANTTSTVIPPLPTNKCEPFLHTSRINAISVPGNPCAGVRINDTLNKLLWQHSRNQQCHTLKVNLVFRILVMHFDDKY